MSTEVLSYADEILSMLPMSRRATRKFLSEIYGVSDEDTQDAVLLVLEGEGYFDV